MATLQSAPTMPAVILETERLRLRALLERDVDDVYASCVDPELQRWIPLPAPGEAYTRESAKHFCLTLAPAIRTGGVIYCLNRKHYPMSDIRVERAW